MTISALALRQQHLAVSELAKTLAYGLHPDDSNAKIWLTWAKTPGNLTTNLWSLLAQSFARLAAKKTDSPSTFPLFEDFFSWAQTHSERTQFSALVFVRTIASTWLNQSGIHGLSSLLAWLDRLPIDINSSDTVWNQLPMRKDIDSLSPEVTVSLATLNTGSARFLLMCALHSHFYGKVDALAWIEALCLGPSRVHVQEGMTHCIRIISSLRHHEKSLTPAEISARSKTALDTLVRHGADWTFSSPKTHSHRKFRVLSPILPESPLALALILNDDDATLLDIARLSMGDVAFWTKVENLCDVDINPCTRDIHSSTFAALKYARILSSLSGFTPSFALNLAKTISLAVWNRNSQRDELLLREGLSVLAPSLRSLPASLRDPWCLPGFAFPESRSISHWPISSSPKRHISEWSRAFTSSGLHRFEAPGVSCGKTLVNALRVSNFAFPWAEENLFKSFNPEPAAWFEAWSLSKTSEHASGATPILKPQTGLRL